MPERSLEQKAHHEAAHAVVEVLHGSAPEHVKIVRVGDSAVSPGWRDRSRDDSGRPLRDPASRRAAEAAILDFYAGAAGVRCYLRRLGVAVDVSYCNGRVLAAGFDGHEGDDNHAREIAIAVWPRAWQRKCASLLGNATRLIEREYVWHAVCDVATALLVQNELQRAELRSIASLIRAADRHAVERPGWRAALCHWTCPGGAW